MVDRPAEPLDELRKRLRFRSWHRGTKEIDLLLGTFADRHLDGLDAAQLARYAALLDRPDPELFEWIVARGVVPTPHNHDILQLLRQVQLSAISY